MGREPKVDNFIDGYLRRCTAETANELVSYMLDKKLMFLSLVPVTKFFKKPTKDVTKRKMPIDSKYTPNVHEKAQLFSYKSLTHTVPLLVQIYKRCEPELFLQCINIC